MSYAMKVVALPFFYSMVHKQAYAASIVDAYTTSAGICGNIAVNPPARASNTTGTRVFSTVCDGNKSSTGAHIVLSDTQVMVKMDSLGSHSGCFKYYWKNAPPWGSYSFAYSSDGLTFTGLTDGYSSSCERDYCKVGECGYCNRDYGCSSGSMLICPFGAPNKNNNNFTVPAPPVQFLWFSMGYPGGAAQLIEIEWWSSCQMSTPAPTLPRVGAPFICNNVGDITTNCQESCNATLSNWSRFPSSSLTCGTNGHLKSDSCTADSALIEQHLPNMATGTVSCDGSKDVQFTSCSDHIDDFNELFGFVVQRTPGPTPPPSRSSEGAILNGGRGASPWFGIVNIMVIQTFWRTCVSVVQPL